MTTPTISAREIQAAGGLAPWLEQARSSRQVASDRNRNNMKMPELVRLLLHPEDYPAADMDSGKCGQKSPAAKGLISPELTIPGAGRMNKLELKYAAHLDTLCKAGSLSLWRYESVRFRLADNTTYLPDFWLLFLDGHIELHETKGFIRDDANVKIKVAASLFPELRFVLVQWKKGKWVFKSYGEGNAKSDE